MQVTAHTEAETLAAGRTLGSVVDARGLVLALIGPLGSGKTVFVRGLAEGLGCDTGLVSSPTFAIAAEHEASSGARLHHVDLYRVESERELEDAGLLDWLAPGGVVAVEWADRIPQALPADRLEVRLARPAQAPNERVLDVRAKGEGARALARLWGRSMQAAGLATREGPLAGAAAARDALGERP